MRDSKLPKTLLGHPVEEAEHDLFYGNIELLEPEWYVPANLKTIVDTEGKHHLHCECGAILELTLHPFSCRTCLRTFRI